MLKTIIRVGVGQSGAPEWAIEKAVEDVERKLPTQHRFISVSHHVMPAPPNRHNFEYAATVTVIAEIEVESEN